MSTESDAEYLLVAFIQENRAAMLVLSGLGDGNLGYVTEVFRRELSVPARTPSRRKKKVIDARLAREVHERSAYRCVTCGSHVDLTCDHIVPESKGGTTEPNNLQTMCRSCNSRKGVAA